MLLSRWAGKLCRAAHIANEPARRLARKEGKTRTLYYQESGLTLKWTCGGADIRNLPRYKETIGCSRQFETAQSDGCPEDGRGRPHTPNNKPRRKGATRGSPSAERTQQLGASSVSLAPLGSDSASDMTTVCPTHADAGGMSILTAPRGILGAAGGSALAGAVSGQSEEITNWGRRTSKVEVGDRRRSVAKASYRRDGLGAQVQDFDLVVVGVGDIEELPTGARTDSAGLVEATGDKIGARGVTCFSRAGQSTAPLGVGVHHFNLRPRID